MNNLLGIIHEDNTFYDKGIIKELPIAVSNDFSVGFIAYEKENVIKIKSHAFSKSITFDKSTNKVISDNVEDIREIISFDKLVNICNQRKEFLIKSQYLLVDIYEIVDKDIHSSLDYKYLNNNDLLDITHENIRIYKELFIDISDATFNNENEIEDFICKTGYAPQVYFNIIELLKFSNLIDNEHLKEKVDDLKSILKIIE